MPPTLKDIMVSPLTYNLLKELGRLDAAAGISKYEGWGKLADECGYSNDRTPAREAYEDGWYTPRWP